MEVPSYASTFAITVTLSPPWLCWSTLGSPSSDKWPYADRGRSTSLVCPKSSYLRAAPAFELVIEASGVNNLTPLIFILL